ncbi:MAG: hypothetical protein IPL61_29100 [Myxococcales bacterium]|nr:hypothetical protein [Myxococcales bacterium]
MRARWFVVVLSIAACGGGQVTNPGLVVPTGGKVEADYLEIEPTAPFAKLFVKGARWQFPLAGWTGKGPAPVITCEVGAQRRVRERAPVLTCTPDRELGPISGGLPRFGVIATAKGLWFTEHLTVVTPLPDDEAGALAWTVAEPMRLGTAPAPVTYEAHAEATDTLPAIAGGIEAFALGDAGTWCLATENAAEADAARTVLCVRADAGIVGGGVATASQGIVTSALTFRRAPPPPVSQPFATRSTSTSRPSKLDAPGKKQRAPLVLTAAVDSAQPIAYQMSGRAVSDDGTGKRVEADQPTLTLRGAAKVVAIEPSGRFRYQFTVAEATATGPGTTPPLASGMASLVGAVFASGVEPDGRVAEYAVAVEHPIPTTPVVVGQVAQSMTTFVALPTEPIGVGATWSSTYPTSIVGQAVTVIVRSKLVSRKGAVAVISSETAIAPIAQAVAGGTARLEARARSPPSTPPAACCRRAPRSCT